MESSARPRRTPTESGRRPRTGPGPGRPDPPEPDLVAPDPPEADLVAPDPPEADLVAPDPPEPDSPEPDLAAPGRPEPDRPEPVPPVAGTAPRGLRRPSRAARGIGRRRRAPASIPVPPAHRPLPAGTQTGQFPRVVTGHRRAVLGALAAVAVLSAAALVVGLSWAPERPEPRALTVDERTRLAAVRVTNYRDLRAGVHVTMGTGAGRTELIGWVDWSRPLVYLDVGGPGAGAERGLLQATPGVALLRPDPAAVPTPASPPLVPPADRWRLAALPAGGRLAVLLDLLFGLAADRPDPPDPGAARWTGRTDLPAGPLDVLDAPLPPARSGTPAPPAAAGPARWWVDRDARLNRLEVRLAGAGPVAVQLNRTDRPTLRPVEALGGRPGTPRALTAAERRRLAALPARLRAAGGAAVTLTAPLAPDRNLTGAGWISWRRHSAYLAVTGLETPGRRTLLRHDGARATQVEVSAPVEGGPPGQPPLPAPARGWTPAPVDGLTALVAAALRTATTAPAGTVLRVRGERLAETDLDVLEMDTPDGPVRHWLDRSGLPHRVELRTAAGTWAQLDLVPGPVPRTDGPGGPVRR